MDSKWTILACKKCGNRRLKRICPDGVYVPHCTECGFPMLKVKKEDWTAEDYAALLSTKISRSDLRAMQELPMLMLEVMNRENFDEVTKTRIMKEICDGFKEESKDG